MKKIGIYCYTIHKDYVWDEFSWEDGSVGGSETWAIKLSNELSKRGYEVYLFGNPRMEHDSEFGVHYLNNSSFYGLCDKVKFDQIILSRTVECLDSIKNCDNIYVMMHDIDIIGFNQSYIGKIKKIMCQSEFQRDVVMSKYKIPIEKFFMTFEAIDHNFYDRYSNVEKRNKMVFSSGFGRGVRWLSEQVFPKIKKEIPDFELDICGHFDGDIIISSLKQDGINVLGRLGKEELAKIQSESKIWIYPNHGYDSEYNRNDETFCITAIENAYAKNACILGDWGCFSSTLKGYSGFVGNKLYSNRIEPMDYENMDSFAEELANDAIKCLKNEEYRLSKVNSSYEISTKYTWKNVADNIEEMFDMKEESGLKTLLCCIGRLENQYIREYVEYYKSIGFTNICLYDNNRDGEDDFHDVIGDYIDSGYVILKDYRNITTPCQFMAYNECYAEYGDKYDWIAFFDIDEYLFMNQGYSISTLLSDKRYDGYKMIHFNWLMFGDCDLVYNDGRPLISRFTTPLNIDALCEYGFPETFHIKSVIRGGLGKITFGPTPHTVRDVDSCCNSYGIACDPKSPFTPYDFRVGGLLHFSTKTAEEYSNKVNRGFCDGNPNTKRSLVELFFKRNKVTKEKVDLFKEKTGVDVSYLLPYEGEKDDNVKIYTLCYATKGFQFLNDSVVTPLQVGAANGTNVCNLKDNTGDNISDSNYFYIESTGTYWIWKNVHDAKYKGQMQYRRPLSGVNETMNFDEIFSKYDVITCEPFNHPENSKPTQDQPMCIPAKTVEEGYAFSNCLDDLLILEMAVKYYFPDYSDDYDKYIKRGENLYYSNGFIMRAEDYDKYAEFLFGCLNGYLQFANIHSKEELIEHVRYNIETGKYIRYEKEPITDSGFKWQTEIGGFLSERLWTLWVQHNFSNDRIYKLPYIKMENNMYT